MTNPDLHIRDATPADADLIAAFNAQIALETEDERLDPETILTGVRTLLADRSRGRYWVAELDGRVAGQIMITYEWSDWRNAMRWWIQSVYVDHDFRRRGVFSALYRHVESLAASDPHVCGLRLYVNRGNGRAQQTYRSLGMSMTDYLIMEALTDGDEKC